MKRYLSYFFIGSSILLFLFTFFSSRSGERLEVLEMQRAAQENERDEILGRVNELKTTLIGMEENPRVLERLAREELLLARDNEQIVLFEAP
ncbi:hypothetical protein EBR25_05335 [bacterium]|jgi:cell division protein FtsB|nr:hypothetical protein [bacterium]